MARLQSLAVETLALLFEYLSPESALNFALTNKYIHASGKLVANRYKSLNLSYDGGRSQIQSWLRKQDVLCGLRHLKVKGRRKAIIISDSADFVKSPWEDLTILVKKLANLKMLTWACGEMIPLSVLEAVHVYQKSSKLRIYGFRRSRLDMDHNDPAEIALSTSPALTVITANAGRSTVPPDPWLACIKRIIASAPNLKSASIVQRFEVKTPAHRQEQEQLEQMFLTHSRPNSSLRRLTLDGFTLNASSLQDWGSLIDLSQLQEIKCSRGSISTDYFTYAPKVLTNIKHLSLNLGSTTTEISAASENYLSICPPLASLSLWSWRGNISLSTILTRHGESLATLQLHEREEIGQPGLRQVLDEEEAKAIRESCPRLKHLTIDRDRHTTELDTEIEADGVLTELAEMKLAKLQVYYDLGCPPVFLSDLEGDSDEGEEGPLESSHQGGGRSKSTPLPPSTDQQIRPFVTQLWTVMFKSCGTASQRTLIVKFGEWERKFGTGFERKLRSMWIAEPHDRDDHSDTCILSKEEVLTQRLTILSTEEHGVPQL